MLLDDGWGLSRSRGAFLLNDDTIRGWHKLFEQRGIEGLTSFDVGGSASFLSAVQEDALKALVGRRCRARRARSAPGSSRNLASFTKAVRD